MLSVPHYKTAIEHIFDELYLLDSLLDIAITKFKSNNSDDSNDWQNQITGLYISNEKIDSIIQSATKSKLPEEPTDSVNKSLMTYKRQAINLKIAESHRHNIFLPLEQISKIFSLSE